MAYGKTLFRGAALSLVAVGVLAANLVTSAAAQTICASERTALIEQLKGRYQEAPVAIGLVSNGSVLEILASNSGSWTILITRPTGLTCVVAAGEAWEELPKLAAGPEA